MTGGTNEAWPGFRCSPKANGRVPLERSLATGDLERIGPQDGAVLAPVTRLGKHNNVGR